MKATNLRAGRTMTEAFGPHTSSWIDPPARPTRAQQMRRAALIAVATVVFTMLAIWLLAFGGVVR